MGYACRSPDFYIGSSWFSYGMGVSFDFYGNDEEMFFFHYHSFPLLVNHGHYYFPVLFSLALFFTVTNYLFAALSDPGVIPRPNADETLQTEKQHNIQADL